MRIEESALFDATPERAWAVLSDWDRQVAWMPDVAWMRLRGTNREVGAELDVRTKVLGVPLVTDRIVVTAWAPPHRLEVEHLGFVRGRGAWVLDPLSGGRTLFTWTEELAMPFGALGDVGLRAYAPVQRAMLRRSIRNLRHLVEI